MTEVRCAGCNKKLLKYDNTSLRWYKSPVKKCKKCGRIYADPRCHEIALEGIPEDTFSVKSHVALMIFGVFLVYRGFHLGNMHQIGVTDEMQWVMPAFLLVLGLIFAIGGVYEIITIVTGIKKRKYDSLRRESEERMKDENYLDILRDLGYNVQEKWNER